MKKILREPLFYFLMLGGFFFALFQLVSDQGFGDPNQLEVAFGELIHIAPLAGAVSLVFCVEGDLIPIEEGVVGAGFGEELDHERDRVD